ncbi:hypothetical protein VCR15J2_390016 [Vibrio coralliirubri]|uniref:hypothetical protein n=1 Tax=Vibrio coralliirubri TaxID=1516159 RepID=UPI0006350741|nr:hypothetical protein [Vibrio coralliirubri]CDT52733.1 hypothetical protein VCR15J2_390016 [Vibrio coralliirubri]
MSSIYCRSKTIAATATSAVILEETTLFSLNIKVIGDEEVDFSFTIPHTSPPVKDHFSLAKNEEINLAPGHPFRLALHAESKTADSDVRLFYTLL